MRHPTYYLVEPPVSHIGSNPKEDILQDSHTQAYSVGARYLNVVLLHSSLPLIWYSRPFM
jgi:hypothetical protein